MQGICRYFRVKSDWLVRLSACERCRCCATCGGRPKDVEQEVEAQEPLLDPAGEEDGYRDDVDEGARDTESGRRDRASASV